MPQAQPSSTGIPAGNLRHLLQIQAESTGQDSFGGPVSSGWSTIRTTRAQIVYAPLNSREVYQASQFTGDVSHIITVRWLAAPEILPGMRVVFGGHTYLIQTVDNADLRNFLINLLCLELNGGQ